jgi:DNA mismatch repair protein MutS
MVHSHDFYKQYQTAYEKYTVLYGQVCVFLQKGSFYEIYGQQDPKTLKQLNTGKEVMELLSLQIHTYPEDGPGGMTGYYGGVPIYTLDKWAGRLTSQGWSVVVIDEIKNGAGKVSKREVSKVLSPGTHIDTAETNQSFFVASLWLEPHSTNAPAFGVAAADLTTGQVYLYEGQATGKADVWHTDDLRHFFQVFPPRELLFYTRSLTTSFDEEMLRRTLYIPNAPIYTKSATSEQQGQFEKDFVRTEYLQETFQPQSGLPLRTWLRVAEDGSSKTERALVCLLRFAEDHAPKLASCLQAPQVWHPKQNLQIINNALTQLNLIGNDSQQCVEDLFATPHTPMGKRGLRTRLCSPLANAAEIMQRQAEVGWILDHPTLQSQLETALAGMYDLARLHRCIIRGTLKATDVLQMYQSYKSTQMLFDIVKNSPLVDTNTAHLEIQLKMSLDSLLESVDIQKAVKAQEKQDETGFLLNSVAPLSASAENQIAVIYSQANQWLTSFRHFAGIAADSLYFKPTDKNMFCLHTTKSVLKTIETAVKSAESSSPYKKTHCKTLTSAGRVEHPQLDLYQEKLDAAKAILTRAMSVEIPNMCIAYALKTRASWQPIEEWILRVDLANCIAKSAKQNGWVRPTIEDTDGPSRLEIKNLRHPLIEIQRRQSKYVTHDISLGYETAGQGWLLYGMNASGKSSLMKAIGLATLLAQVGSYVPATEMTLRPFHRIATRILNQDNLWAGLSSFAVEMSELREILSVADDQTLVLGDELCAGTESISGTAIVAAGIQHLYKAGSRFVLATHLHDLMKLPAVTSLHGLQVWHLHVEYDPVKDTLVYHRALKPGAGSSMYGLEVAKALHLPRDMIEAAFEMRRTLLGSSAIEETKESSWNTAITRRSCSVCGSIVEKDLEVHHIEERAHATINKRNKDGTALNHVRNLAVLCQKCHDKHHAGLLHVGPVEDTSQGPKRQITDLSQFAYNPEKVSKEKVTKKGKSSGQFSAEKLSAMQTLVRQTPGLTPRLWCFQIQQSLEIQITESQFKTLQKNGAF